MTGLFVSQADVGVIRWPWSLSELLVCRCPVVGTFISSIRWNAEEGMRVHCEEECMDWEFWRGAPCYRAVSCVVGPPPPSNCLQGGDSRVELFKFAACLGLPFRLAAVGRDCCCFFHHFPKYCETWGRRLWTHPCLASSFPFRGLFNRTNEQPGWHKLV